MAPKWGSEVALALKGRMAAAPALTSCSHIPGLIVAGDTDTLGGR